MGPQDLPNHIRREDPYHTEFVSWRVDNFFFPLGGGVRRLVENSTNFFFFEPFPYQIPIFFLKFKIGHSKKIKA